MFLALFVAILMLATVIPASLVAYADPEKLVDLDYSTYVKDTTTDPYTATTSIGSITNNGSLNESTKVTMSSQYYGGGWNSMVLNKGTFTNMDGGNVPFLHMTQNQKACDDKNRFRVIDESALEEGNNTIVFWAKYTPYLGQNIIGLLQYFAVYDDGTAETPMTLMELNSNSVSDTAQNAAFKICGKKDEVSSMRADITADAAGKWAQFVITNPEYEYNSTTDSYAKKMRVYVNGNEVAYQTVEQPEGEVKEAKLCFGGDYFIGSVNPDKESGAKTFWPMDIYFGEIQVYDEAMFAEDIENLYNAEKDTYNENTAIAPVEDTDPIAPPTPGPGGDDPVVDPYAGNALINLDMSTYVEDTESNPDTVNTSIGGIVNTGSLKDTTVVKMSANNDNTDGSPNNWRYLTLKKETLRSVNGSDTAYIHRTIVPDNCYDKNSHSIIIENGLEETANTISFWAKYVPVNKGGQEYNILDYNVTYGSTSSHLFTLDQAPTTSGNLKLVGHAQSPIYGDVTEDAADKWALYTVTNPKYDTNGTKTMKVYVNGKYLGSTTVEKPEGNLSKVRLCFGGEYLPKRAGYNWPTDISLGDITVYEGEMTGTEIESVYEATKSKYTVDESFITDEDAGPTKSPILVRFGLDNFGYSLEGGSGITNEGTSETAQFDIHSVEADNYNISINKQTLYDKNLQKVGDYILLTHDRGEFDEAGKNIGMEHHFKITDEAFENDSITVSFWVNIDRGIRQTAKSQYVQPVQYEVKYTYDGEVDVLGADNKPTGEKEFKTGIPGYLRARVFQTHYEADGAPTWNEKYEPNSGTYAIATSHEWHHVVMSIPRFNEDGKKIVKTYVDGALKKEAEMVVPTDLENMEMYTPAFRIGGDQNSNYVPDDMSISDFKIYRGAFPKDSVTELYNLEKDKYIDNALNDNVAVNKVSFKKTDGTIVNRLDSPTEPVFAGETIKIGIKENIEPDFRIFVGAYDECGNLIDITFKNSGEIEGNVINYTLKDNTDKIRVFTWFADKMAPIQKVAGIEKGGY